MIEATTNPVIWGKLVVNRELTSGRIFFANTPISYPHMANVTVKAACWILVFNRFQFCYTAIAEVASFLCDSCSHLQVQTVPSSTRELRVQSLHLPVKAWLGVFCSADYIILFCYLHHKKLIKNPTIRIRKTIHKKSPNPFGSFTLICPSVIY